MHDEAIDGRDEMQRTPTVHDQEVIDLKGQPGGACAIGQHGIGAGGRAGGRLGTDATRDVTADTDGLPQARPWRNA